MRWIKELSILLCSFTLVLISGCRDCRFGCENGRCIRGVCQCNENWEGDACERFVISKHVGSYARLDTCISKQMDTVTLNPGDRSMNQLIWDGSLRLNFFTETEFDVPEQVYLNDTVEGDGQMLVDGISIRYESINSGKTESCLSEAIKID
ncbi:MAG: hypothetical protein Salg2KO_06230 [Salibacteraceae bacterium]